jgi:hypothetical protein
MKNNVIFKFYFIILLTIVGCTGISYEDEPEGYIKIILFRY